MQDLDSYQDPNQRLFDNSLNFKKIGYFSYDANHATDYQAREMKSVFLDVTTQYLKFVFYQPYENRYNIFDQVGVVSITVLGEPHLSTEEAVAHQIKYGSSGM